MKAAATIRNTPIPRSQRIFSSLKTVFQEKGLRGGGGEIGGFGIISGGIGFKGRPFSFSSKGCGTGLIGSGSGVIGRGSLIKGGFSSIGGGKSVTFSPNSCKIEFFNI